MKKLICDRCGNEIDESNGIYHIRIIGEGDYAEPIAKNIEVIMGSLMHGEKDYCIDCINEIEAVIKLKKGKAQ